MENQGWTLYQPHGCLDQVWCWDLGQQNIVLVTGNQGSPGVGYLPRFSDTCGPGGGARRSTRKLAIRISGTQGVA